MEICYEDKKTCEFARLHKGHCMYLVIGSFNVKGISLLDVVSP